MSGINTLFILKALIYFPVKRILITNDDGIDSPGLKALENSLEGLGEVWVIVPETQKSGAGRGLTVHEDITLKKISTHRYTLNATPASAVSIAAKKLIPKLDLVVSGINLGANIGVDAVMWSGTCGAAFEAAGFGIPGIATSFEVLDNKQAFINNIKHDFSHAEHYLRKIFVRVLGTGMPKGVSVLNINFPNGKPKGVSATTIGAQYIRPLITEKTKNCFRIGGEFVPKPVPGNDVHAVLEKRHVSISPITLKGFDVNTSLIMDFIKEL